jgi:undecaprenyl-diphosphatase
MDLLIKAIILGIIQGLTEFLPVSSSGHIELGKALFDADFKEDNLTFSIIVHAATVLSTIVVFRKDILSILQSLLKFKWNEDTRFVLMIVISMIPVLIVGLFFKDFVESFFDGKIVFVGIMLLVTATLLLLTQVIKSNTKPIGPLNSIIVGVAQAIAVLPGISRSGATIATGLMLGIDKTKMARFSFLMVIPPIVGATLLDVKKLMSIEAGDNGIEAIVLIGGFVTAFITGLFACSVMIKIVREGKIQYFAYYCILVGLIAISTQWF